MNNTARTFTSCVPIESAPNIFHDTADRDVWCVDDDTIDVIRWTYDTEPMPHVGINDVVLARVQPSSTFELASVVAIEGANEILVRLRNDDDDDDDDDTEYVVTRFDIVPWKNGTVCLRCS